MKHIRFMLVHQTGERWPTICEKPQLLDAGFHVIADPDTDDMRTCMECVRLLEVHNERQSMLEDLQDSEFDVQYYLDTKEPWYPNGWQMVFGLSAFWIGVIIGLYLLFVH